jgi:hypothetical protein
MRNRSSDDFGQVLAVSELLATSLSGPVFIGGVAVYLHSVNSTTARSLVEVSHDTDVVVSLVDLSVLRDQVEVVANRRLRKNQIVLEGIEVDVYVENQNSLAVPYDELRAHSVEYGPVKVACPEHLLILKLVAGMSRGGSAKGEKDERDVVRLSVLDHSWDRSLIEPYIGPEHLEILRHIARSRVFSALCGRNEHEATKLRRKYEKFLTKIV